ncbi:hypothetical protein JCM19376_30250 [Fusibacter bizertensis]
MILYLMYEYKNKIKPLEYKKISEIPKMDLVKIAIILIVGVLIIISSFMQINLHWSLFLAYIGFLGVTVYFSEKKYIKNIDGKVIEYNKRIDTMRNILKSDNYKLYSEMKIRELVRQISLDLDKKNKKMSKEVLTILLIPIFLQWTDLIFNNSRDNESLGFMSAIVITIGIFYGMWMMIKPIVDEIKDAEKIILNRLKSLLEDILLVDFIN